MFEWLKLPVFGWWYCLLWLIIPSILVVVFSKLIVVVIQSLMIRTKISKAFFGAVILGILSALPEITIASFAGSDESPSIAIFNQIGANVFLSLLMSLVILGSITLLISKRFVNRKSQNRAIQIVHGAYKISEPIFFIKKCFGDLNKDLRFSIIILLPVNLLYLLFVWVKRIGYYWYIPGINISIISFVPILIYIGFAIYTLIRKKTNTEEVPSVENDILKKISTWILWILLLVLAFFLFFSAYCATQLVQNIKGEGFWKNALILSMISVSPEVFSFLFLYRGGEYETAISSISGSQLRNLSLVIITDSIIRRPVFQDFFEQPSNLDYDKWNNMVIGTRWWIIVSLLMMVFTFFLIFRKVNTNIFISVALLIINVLIFLIATIVLVSFGI